MNTGAIIPNSGGGLRWFSRFLTAHGHTDVLSSQILVVVCGGLRWFVVVCGGLWWIAVVCLLVIPHLVAEFRVPDKKGFCFVRAYDGITGQSENN